MRSGIRLDLSKKRFSVLKPQFLLLLHGPILKLSSLGGSSLGKRIPWGWCQSWLHSLFVSVGQALIICLNLNSLTCKMGIKIVGILYKVYEA
jgi:hypothetical protein